MHYLQAQLTIISQRNKGSLLPDDSSQVHTDLREDAGSGGDSAVHHTVEDGEQAVQREGLWPQQVVTCLENVLLQY